MVPPMKLIIITFHTHNICKILKKNISVYSTIRVNDIYAIKIYRCASTFILFMIFFARYYKFF